MLTVFLKGYTHIKKTHNAALISLCFYFKVIVRFLPRGGWVSWFVNWHTVADVEDLFLGSAICNGAQGPDCWA